MTMPDRPASARPEPQRVTAERLSPDEAAALRRGAIEVPGAAADAPGSPSGAFGGPPPAPEPRPLFRSFSTLPQAALGFVQEHPVATAFIGLLGMSLLQAVGGVLRKLPVESLADGAGDADVLLPSLDGQPRRARRARQPRRPRRLRAKAS